MLDHMMGHKSPKLPLCKFPPDPSINLDLDLISFLLLLYGVLEGIKYLNFKKNEAKTIID